MPPGVLGVVLALAVHVVGGLLEDLRSVSSRVLAVRDRVLHAYEHRVCDLAGTWRYAVWADVADDHRATFADVHLRPMVFADLKAFDESESLTQPTHRRAHIGIDEDRDRGRARDRSVRQHASAAYERTTKASTARPRSRKWTGTPPRERRRWLALRDQAGPTGGRRRCPRWRRFGAASHRQGAPTVRDRANDPQF